MPKEIRMSPLRRQILIFIKDYKKQFGKTPSQRVIAKEIGKALGTTNFHLHKLEAMGRIRIPKQHRIELIEDDK